MNEATPMDVSTNIMSSEKEVTGRKSMKTNQKKITTANSTVVKMRKADPYASWEGDQSRKANGIRRGLLQLWEDGPKKKRLLQDAGAKTKANRMADEDTPGVSMDSKGGLNHYNSGYEMPVRERVHFTIICTSTAATVSERR